MEGGGGGEGDFAAVMEAAPCDGCLYLTKFRVDLSYSPPLSLSPQMKIWRGRGSEDGVESGVGGGVGLLERERERE